MYQLAMSHIHDEAASERYDSDSCVPNITDPLIALQAFATYVERLSNDFGVKFDLTTDRNPDDTTLVMAAQAYLDGPHGPSTIYVELQDPRPQDDVDRIVDLMRAKTHYKIMQHPA